MQLVEQYVIARANPSYAIVDEAAFKSKNLYSETLPSSSKCSSTKGSQKYRYNRRKHR